MKIGIFTDTYHPSINGIVYVVDSTKRYLEARGHEVYIFCPARSMRPHAQSKKYHEDEHVIRFPSIKGVLYDENDLSFFFPPAVLRRIKELELDVIHFVTTGQVGILGVFAASNYGVPLVAQHCTDIYEYIEHYSNKRILFMLLASVATVPFSMRLSSKELKEIISSYRPRRSTLQWNSELIERLTTFVYARCDVVIALSRKSKEQLESWQRTPEQHYDVTLLPNGVDALPETAGGRQNVRQRFGFAPDDHVIGFVGRLGSEKNLALLIPMLARVREHVPSAKLLIVGGGEMADQLAEQAHTAGVEDAVVLSGPLPRQELGDVYAAMDCFVFPSVTDTQGWVLHEAAHAGLPIVLTDPGVSEVVRDDYNGYLAEVSADSLAESVTAILGDPKRRRTFGARSRQLAANYSEAGQLAKLVELYEAALRRRDSASKANEAAAD